MRLFFFFLASHVALYQAKAALSEVLLTCLPIPADAGQLTSTVSKCTMTFVLRFCQVVLDPRSPKASKVPAWNQVISGVAWGGQGLTGVQCNPALRCQNGMNLGTALPALLYPIRVQLTTNTPRFWKRISRSFLSLRH